MRSRYLVINGIYPQEGLGQKGEEGVEGRQATDGGDGGGHCVSWNAT
jgi:hypothetical protein